MSLTRVLASSYLALADQKPEAIGEASAILDQLNQMTRPGVVATVPRVMRS